MKISRLFQTVYLLVEHKTMTAAELAERLEVSPRTVLRDIEALCAAGVPLYTSQGKGGGISIMDSFVLNKATVTAEEQEQILLALQSMQAASGPGTREALSKMQSLFQRSDADWITVDFSRWGFATTDAARFDALKEAIIDQRQIAFTYTNQAGNTALRRAYPLRLAFKSAAWYLQAFCCDAQDHRIFKVVRMRAITQTGEGFDRSAFHVPPAEYGAQPDLKAIKLRLRLAPEVASRAFDEFEADDITEHPDGSCTVTARMLDERWLYTYILSFGAYAKVLAPKALAREVAAQAQAVVAQYA